MSIQPRGIGSRGPYGHWHHTYRGMIRQSPLAKWELLGIPVVFLAGSALHFAFDWSGYWKPLAIIAAVNESVWEHLKLAFWPSLLWALIGYAAFKPNAWAFWSAKGYALLVAPVLIVVIFYGYTSILGRNYLSSTSPRLPSRLRLVSSYRPN